MKLLSNENLQQVSGGISVSSKEGYDSMTRLWGVIGFLTAAVSTSVIPQPFGAYFAVRLAFISAGGVAGYAVGAIGYYLSDTIHSTIDYYLAPEQ